ncbi:unnamed protein product [Effrenium voratum]|nr:unnamed protein product [Effrenium voratum]
MSDVLIECDLYISSEEEIQLQNFFQDSFTTATCLTHGEFEKQSFKLMLAEIAETPSSVRAKLWQIERALKFGPDDISHPDVCVVCINGEQGQFDMAASAAKAALKKMGPQVLLKRFPVFAVWTAYRNIYAELRTVNEKIDDVKKEMKSEIDDVKKEMKSEIDDVKKEMKSEIDDVKSEIDDVKKEMGEIGSKLDRVSPNSSGKTSTTEKSRQVMSTT